MKARALSDVKVLDLSRAAAGPFCTMMLADMGADVIKVEMPNTGDDCRHFGPPFIGGESPYFLIMNRNKRSVTLNMKAQRGKDILKEMVCKCDVLVENFRPGAMARLGLDYEQLRPLNPGLIYCSITGFGATGPDAHLPGYDLIAQGMGGIMSVTGEPGGRSLRVGIAQADLTTGMFAAYGILTALHHRGNTGEGQKVETSLYESQIAQLTFQAGRYFATGESPEAAGNQHPIIAPYESFKTNDGEVNIAVGSQPLWSNFCNVMDLGDYEKDPRFESNAKRVENREALIQIIEEKTSQYGLAEICEILNEAGIPNGPVRKMHDVLNAPQTIALEMVQELDHPVAGKIRVTGIPVKMSLTSGDLRIPPPVLGQHTAEVLNELLGIDSAEVQKLHDEEVV
jgi:CoA:oxalate CoA-transferase